MNNRTTFVFTAALSACVSLAGLMVNADSGADDTVLATPVGIATVRNCELKGEIVEEEDGIFAVFTATNTAEAPEATEIAFSYGVSYMAASSAMSRMVAMPQTVKSGKCTIKVEGSGKQVARIRVQDRPKKGDVEVTKLAKPTIQIGDAKATSQQNPFAPGSATWTLWVSKSETATAGGWSAVSPSAILKRAELGEGAIVLASRSADTGPSLIP